MCIKLASDGGEDVKSRRVGLEKAHRPKVLHVWSKRWVLDIVFSIILQAIWNLLEGPSHPIGMRQQKRHPGGPISQGILAGKVQEKILLCHCAYSLEHHASLN